MKRIILHWTAGTYQPNTIEFEHYHYLVNGDGLIIKGKHCVQDNKNCTDGNYAAHTGGGNTGSIGVAVCGMKDYKNKNNVGNYPLTSIQCEAMYKLVAELCKTYAIPITVQTVLTHYEFGQCHPKTTSYGKIDITWLPKIDFGHTDDVGRYIRSKVRWYFQKYYS